MRDEKGVSMSTALRYYLNGLILTVWPDSYLVEVRTTENAPLALHTLRDLPEWALRSRLAIWLTEGREPIRERAISGERIRRRLTGGAEQEHLVEDIQNLEKEPAEP
jgi:hypothetical protein